MRSIWGFLSARPVLGFLLLGDSLFILLHVLWLAGLLPTAFLFDVERDGGIPEIFNYLKWTACILGCLWLFQQKRERLYLLWALVFLYLLIDDSFSIHEVVGALLAYSMKWQSAFALREIDFGEIAVMLLAGVAVLAPVAVAYLLSADEVAKAFSRNLMLWLVALAVFGCGIDMLHIMVSNWSGVYAAIGTIEDGGEMVVASVLTFLVWRERQTVLPSARLVFQQTR